MTRKQNLMAACVAVAALASAWLFSDSVHAPFSRKGMAEPVQEEQVAAAPAGEHAALSAEDVERVLQGMAQRSELARSVQDAASARAFIDDARSQSALTAQASRVLYLLNTGVDGSGEQQDSALNERLAEAESVFAEHLEAVHAMYSRVYEADGYGDPVIQACLAFDAAIVLNLAASQTLGSLETRRQMAEWEQRQAEEGQAGEQAGAVQDGE